MMVSKDSGKHEDASCNAGDLLDGLKKSEILADDGEIAVQVSFRDGEILLSRHGSCIGDSEVVIEADVLGGEASAKINPIYMREWLATVDQDENVMIRYPTTGVQMQLSTHDGGYYTQSVMVDVVQTASSV
jgi:DNA polymerase III sliding clamp (beta) subunit (PCNA family)